MKKAILQIISLAFLVSTIPVIEVSAENTDKMLLDDLCITDYNTLSDAEANTVYKAPTITFEKGESCVKLNWTSVASAEKYGIVGWINNRWQLIDQCEDTSYVLNNLKAGNNYKVAVVTMIGNEWHKDFSNAITVTPLTSAVSKYPNVTNIKYSDKYPQFKLEWNAVDGATQYGIAVKLAGKWKVWTYTDETDFISPKLKAGSTAEMVICAKVNGEWDTSNINSRAFVVTIDTADIVPVNSSGTDSNKSAIAGKIFAYEKEGVGGYCTLSFNENGRFLFSPGKLSNYMGGGDWKIDGDTVSLIGMVNKTIYLKITDDTLVYIAEGSDEFPYMDIKDGEKFSIYRPEISSDKIQLNSRYTNYGQDEPKIELDLIVGDLPEFCYVEKVELYDEDDNFIGTMSPALDADLWSYLVDCNVTEECSKTYYTLTKLRCGEKSYLDDVRSEITVNFKVAPAPLDKSAIAGKIFAYEKEGAGGYCTLSFNENGRFLFSPGKLSNYMGGGDWKIDGDTVSLIGMVNKTIYLKITDDTLVYIAEGSDEFPYMDIKDGEKFSIYRPEISSDKIQLNSRYTNYGQDEPKIELDLIVGDLPEFCYVEKVELYDEDDNFIGTMSPAMDADLWSYLVDCNVTEEFSKTYYTLTKIRCGGKNYLDDVRSEITVNFK